MTYHMSSLSPFSRAFVFAAVSLHDPFRGELGKTQLLNRHVDSTGLLNMPQESPGHCPGREVTALGDSPSNHADYLQRSERGASLLCFLLLPWKY